jgi:NAD(P)-dependent dehydrogenase (short-subunit alcohol dehydrogenase family)
MSLEHVINGFAGRLVAVTGAASGIGAATASALIAAGGSVISIDRTVPEHPVGDFVQCDLADRDSILAAAEHLPHGLAALLNIAGVPGTSSADTVARVNFLGPRLLTETVLPKIVPGGAVVSVASTAGDNWRENLSQHVDLAATAGFSEGLAWLTRHDWPKDRAYQWFKEALIVWTMARSETMRNENAVRLCCVSPGPVATPILAEFRRSLGDARVDDAIRRGGGVGQPIDIATTILFLASPAARWLIGTNLIVDGGALASRLTEQTPEIEKGRVVNS